MARLYNTIRSDMLRFDTRRGRNKNYSPSPPALFEPRHHFRNDAVSDVAQAAPLTGDGSGKRGPLREQLLVRGFHFLTEALGGSGDAGVQLA